MKSTGRRKGNTIKVVSTSVSGTDSKNSASWHKVKNASLVLLQGDITYFTFFSRYTEAAKGHRLKDITNSSIQRLVVLTTI